MDKCLYPLFCIVGTGGSDITYRSTEVRMFRKSSELHAGGVPGSVVDRRSEP